MIKDPVTIKEANKLAEQKDRDSTDQEEDSDDSDFSDVCRENLGLICFFLLFLIN